MSIKIELTKESCLADKRNLRALKSLVGYSEGCSFEMFTVGKTQYKLKYDYIAMKLIGDISWSQIEYIKLFDYFDNPIEPTPEELTLFELETSYDWLFSNKEKADDFIQKHLE